MSGFSRLVILAREHPVAAALEAGTVLACFLLFIWTFTLLASGPPTGRGDPWLAIVVVGASTVLLWTVVVPLYERTV